MTVVAIVVMGMTIVVARSWTIDHDVAVAMARRGVVVARTPIVAAVIAGMVAMVIATIVMAMISAVRDRDAERGARHRADDRALIARHAMADDGSDTGADEAAGGLVSSKNRHRSAGEQRAGDEENFPVHVNFSVSGLDRGRSQAAVPVCKHCGASMEFHSCRSGSNLHS